MSLIVAWAHSYKCTYTLQCNGGTSHTKQQQKLSCILHTRGDQQQFSYFLWYIHKYHSAFLCKRNEMERYHNCGDHFNSAQMKEWKSYLMRNERFDFSRCLFFINRSIQSYFVRKKRCEVKKVDFSFLFSQFECPM